jgi:hypothetical protein
MSARTTGRVVGALFLVQVLFAPLVYFRLLPPGNRATFLETAAPQAPQVRLAILLATLFGVVTIAIGVALWPIIRRHSERLAVAYVAMGLGCFALLGMENLLLRQMLALSTQYAAGEGREAIAALGPVVRESWRQAHYTTLMFAHGTGFLLHVILFRHSLVPRVIAGAGMAAALFSVAAVAGPLMGGTFRFAMMTPIAIVQLALILWLLVRGLRETAPAT